METFIQTGQSRRISPQNDASGQSVGEKVGRHGQDAAEHLISTPAKEILDQLKRYAHEKPDVAICWCFAIGVVVGWKLR